MRNKLMKIDYTYLKEINIKANKFIAKVLSISFLSGSILYLISQYLFAGVSTGKAISFSLVFIFLSILVQIVLYFNLPVKVTTHLLSLITFFSLPVIVLEFTRVGGVTIWILPFISTIIALSFTSNIMIMYMMCSGLLTQSFLWLVKPEALVLIDSSDYIARIGLLLLAGAIAIKVNNIYVKRIRANLEYMKYIEKIAYHDPLTGLSNRIFLFEKMEAKLKQAKKNGNILALFYLNLDYFQIVNETIGHDYGDELLKNIARGLQIAAGDNSLVSRVGGDEFVIMSPDIISFNNIEDLAEKLLDFFRAPANLNGQDFYITTSIGIASFPDDGKDPSAIFRSANIAMQLAKKRGRNQYVLSTTAFKVHIEENAKIRHHLATALKNNEFFLHYQPQVDSASEEVTGFEALLRWNNFELGLVPPGRFIPLAEQTILIRHIGLWVLRTSCRQMKYWQDQGLPPVKIAVNLSLAQLENPHLVKEVTQTLKETGLNPKYLELEITENMGIQELSYVVSVLESFKKLGITITIDDFGTDFSSLKFLKQLPIDKVKIAMVFVHGMLDNPTDEAIINMIILLSKNLQLDLIAEGVESKEQLIALLERGCHNVQGYYYSKPLSASQAEEFLLKMNVH